MRSESVEGPNEVRRIRRMLRSMGRMAREASLVGGMERGARSSVHQYNQAVRRLEELEAIPRGFFPPLGEDAPFEETGVAAAQLAAYIAEDEEPPHPGRRGGFGSGNHIHISGVGGLRELRELKELGRMIREHLPEWLREQAPAGPPEPPEPPRSPGHALSQVESRLAEVGARLQAVAEQLRRGDLSDEQRAELAEQLSRLGQEQAGLAREHAALRERIAG